MGLAVLAEATSLDAGTWMTTSMPPTTQSPSWWPKRTCLVTWPAKPSWPTRLASPRQTSRMTSCARGELSGDFAWPCIVPNLLSSPVRSLLLLLQRATHADNQILLFKHSQMSRRCSHALFCLHGSRTVKAPCVQMGGVGCQVQHITGLGVGIEGGGCARRVSRGEQGNEWGGNSFCRSF